MTEDIKPKKETNEVMATAEAKEWKIQEEDLHNGDPLLSCLLFLSKHVGTPTSASTLTERLPLEDGKLTPKLFVKAAERARLAAEINKISLEGISNEILPAVLLLHNGEASVLLEKDEKNAIILNHKTGKGKITIAVEDLEKAYTGFAIFVKPIYEFTRKTKEVFKSQTKHWFWSVMMKSWPLYAEVLVASFIINIFALAMPLFAMNVYDRVVPNQAMDTMWVLASGIGLIFIFDLFLKMLRAYFIDLASKKTDIHLSSIIFEQILGVQMGARPSSVGAFANTVQSFESFRDFITSTSVLVFVDLPFTVIYLLVMYFLGGVLVVIPLTIIPLVFILSWFMQYPLINLTKQTYQVAQEKQATLIESLAGIEAIKSSGAEGTMQRRFEQAVLAMSKLSAKMRLLVNSSTNITSLAQQVAYVAMVILGVYKIIQGDLTMGGLIACSMLAGRATAPIGQVSGIFIQYYKSMEALHGIADIMRMPTDVAEDKTYLHRPDMDGNIELENVEFHYPNQPSVVLNGISFSVKQGERIGLIGRTGSGKSTIAKLIMGLYRPDKGCIKIDGTDYLQINPADLRKQIGYVPQDVILFYGSIKDNIRLGAPQVDDEKLLKAAEIAGVTNFTKNHPEGFDRQVGERGFRLSGGQRQAVALARALLLSPKLLLLDEPTASMDDGSEATLRQNLKNYLHNGSTLLLVTHKASMLDLVDRLIVLDNARIVADGPKEAVLNALRSGIKLQQKG